MDTKRVWFVTGASKGLGCELVKKLLHQGYSVVATSRNERALREAIGEASDTFLPLQVDLLDETSVSDAVREGMDRFGRLDVIVNNAGYGQLGTLEELSDGEARRNFDVNVFGTLNVIRHVMPVFRKQRFGHVINVSSIAGMVGSFPGWGVYCATKFAVVGLTESLSAEAAEFGVSATVVLPGYFRTDFLEGSSLNLPANEIAAYEAARKLQAAHVNDINGEQAGDPAKAARAFLRLGEMEQPPLHFFMGSDAYGMAEQKVATLQRAMLAEETLSKSTDY